MAFRDFTFPQVVPDLGLTPSEADLYAQVPEVAVRAEFAAALAEGATLALAVNTEKAKSEFIIAPLLLELRRLVGGRLGLFSGVELDVDSAKGLNGVCDFFLSKEARLFVLTAPRVAIVEAKNDNLRNGLGASASRRCTRPSCSTRKQATAFRWSMAWSRRAVPGSFCS